MKKLLTFLLTALLAFSVGWAETATLTNANIVNAGTANTSYQAWTITDGNSKTWNAYAIKNYHSKATSSYHYLQIKKYASNTAYYIQVPEFGTKITQIVMTVSSTGQPMSGGGNSATLYFSSSNSTSATGTGVASGTGSSTVTINCSSLNLNTGYITASGAVRIWDVTVTYESGTQPTQTCATPSFSPAEGTYSEAQNVTISCSNPSDATIYYTTDGTMPTTSSFVYSSAIPVSETTTIKAMAVKSGYNNSDVATATYTIESSGSSDGEFTIVRQISELAAGNEIIFVQKWEASTTALAMSTTQNGNNRGTTTVSISANKTIQATDETQIITLEGDATNGWYFNVGNGYLYAASSGNNYLKTEATPDENNNALAKISFAGLGGLPVSTIEFQGTNTRKYIRFNTSSSIVSCYGSNSDQSPVYIYQRIPTPKVATPTFTPEPGTYTSAQNVTISCATEGATIHYTYNGGAEQTGTSPITLYVNSTAEIVAWATLADYEDSDPVPATYTINLTPTLTASPTTVNINDDHSANGRKGSFTVTGTNIGTDNVGVTRTNDKFTPALSATTGTTYAGEYNGTPYWGFTPAGSLEGTVEMTYNGHALSATTAVTLANAEGANHVSAVVNVNYLYTGPIYIMGYVNENGWAANNGELMDRDESTGNYSKTLTLLDSGDGHAYISFTKALANSTDDWNSIAGDRFGPDSNGNWTFNEQLVNVPCALDTMGGYWSIKIPAGEWVVSIDPNTNTFTLVPHVPAPVFDPAGGRYETAQDVEITCTNVDAHIYYTTDGSTPSANNGTLYTGPITVSAESTTIKAIAIYGNASSTVTTATYTIKPIGADDFILVESDNDITAGDEYVLVYTSTTGVHHAMSTTFGNNFYEETTDTDEDFTLADGVVTLLQDPSNVNVLTLEEAGDYFYIKDHDSNYLYYTGSNNNVYRSATNAETDGYKWQMTINSDGDVVIRNVGTSGSSTRYLQSNPSSNRYACYKTSSNMFDPKLYKKGTSTVPAPQITPAGGTSNKRFESVEVTITAADGCRIYYTTDGTAPSVNSTEYTGVFVLPYGSAPTTVKAIAVDGEGKVSRVTTVVYYWDRVQVSISPASKEVVGNVDVTITPSPSDATVTYTINGGESQTYNGQFTVQVNEENTPVTVEATAVKGESTATASVTYTYKDGGVNSIAEFLALDNNEERFFKNPVVVLFDYSQDGDQDYIWVKDRTGYMKLFIQPGFDEETSKPRYNNGDVIPEGFTVKKITYTEHDASFIEGKSEDPSLDNFKNPTERALADPEQVKLSELLANPAYYNDRYLYINKLEITGHSGVNYTVASDENGDDESEVFGTTIVCYNKFPTWKEKDGTGHTVTIPSGDGIYYNVKFIFQKYGSVYEIMPIEFTPWEENKVRLEDLVKIEVSTPYKEYTISNDLIATKVTWDDNKGKFAIFAKDDEAYASPRHRLDGQESYFIRYENVNHPELNNTVMQEDYDQSNWVEILIPSAIDRKLHDGYQSQLDEFKSQFENKILPGGLIHGTYIDKLNPTIEYNLSVLPSNLATSDYKPNIYTPVNFLMENLDDEGSEAGAKSYRTDALGNQYFFMMDAKPHETCMVVWGYYPGDGDYFYIPRRIGDQVNGHQFHGIFKADMSLCEDPNVSTANGSTVKSCFPEASDVDGADMDHVKLFGFDAIVRKNPDYNWSGSNGAPRRVNVAPYTEGQENVPAYIVYPLNAAENASGIVTGVEELNVLMKDVESVRYYNIMGMESEKPFEGINIVVTRYTDGSTSTAKILR